MCVAQNIINKVIIFYPANEIVYKTRLCRGEEYFIK